MGLSLQNLSKRKLYQAPAKPLNILQYLIFNSTYRSKTTFIINLYNCIQKFNITCFLY